MQAAFVIVVLGAVAVGPRAAAAPRPSEGATQPEAADDAPPPADTADTADTADIPNAPDTRASRLARLTLADLAIDDAARAALRWGGIGAVAVGAAGVLGGMAPALVYGARKADLAEATRVFSGAQADVDTAARLHREMLESRAAFNDVGRFIALGGLVLALAGGAAWGASALLPALPPESTESPAPAAAEGP